MRFQPSDSGAVFALLGHDESALDPPTHEAASGEPRGRDRPADALRWEGQMERPMSIMRADETTPVADYDAPVVVREVKAREPETERLTHVRRRTPSAPQRIRFADGGIPVVDDRMRLPSFVETCPHVRDSIIPLNGGRFNVDHYLRVLRAKAETDVSIAMALTVRAG